MWSELAEIAMREDDELHRARAMAHARLFGALEPLGGSHIGRFQLERMLGRGGMGCVYAAFDPRLERTVALKVLRRPEDGADHVRDEAVAMARTSHPNVVAIYEVDRAGDDVYIAMEYVPGSSLDTWQGTPRRWRQVVEVYAAIAEGLQALHDAGVVHGDLKPHNVLMTPRDVPRITDFGLARRGDADGVHGGSEGFVAPEVASGQRPSPAADQYAFFVGLRLALANTIDTPPAMLRALLVRGLHHAPDRRFASMTHVASRLRASVGASRPWKAAAVVGLAALVVIGWPSLVPTRCERTAAEIERAHASASLDRWGQLGLPPQRAASTAETIEASYAALASASRQVCEARRDDPGIQQARVDCLRRQTDELDATVAVFQDVSLDAAVHTAQVLASLPTPAACLHRVPPSPLDEAPEVASQRRTMEHELARIRALRRVWRNAEVRDRAQALLERATGRFPRIEAAALHELALESKRRLDRRTASLHLERAALAAEAGGDVHLAARSAVLLLSLTVDDDLARAEALGPRVRQLVAAAADPALEVELGIGLGRLALAHGDGAEAIRLQRAAIDQGERALGVHEVVAHAHAHLAGTYSDLGDHTRALASKQAALEHIRRLPSSIPGDDAVLLLTMGNLLRSAGRLDEAGPFYARALQSVERAYGETHPKASQYHRTLARWHELRAELDDARSHAAWVERHAPSTERARAALMRARMSLAFGDGASAAAILDGLPTELDRGLQLDALLVRASIAHDASSPSEELALAMQALGMLAGEREHARRDLAPLSAVARAQVRAGLLDEAEETLDRARSILDRPGVEPLDRFAVREAEAELAEARRSPSLDHAYAQARSAARLAYGEAHPQRMRWERQHL